jgi:UrcA family protein
MKSRKAACLLAAGFISLSLTVAATADARPRNNVVVEGERFDPETQRRVSYADLNLAFGNQQKVLKSRISRAASRLCFDLDQNGIREHGICRESAVDSTRGQVALAIQRAKDQMAGRAVGPAIAIAMAVGGR